MDFVDRYTGTFSKFDFFPFNDVFLIDGNLAVRRKSFDGPLCGYVAIPKEDIPQALWDAIKPTKPGSTIVDLANNLYAGINYASREEQNGIPYAVFGFDFGHDHDKLELQTRTPERALSTARQMEKCILNNAEKYNSPRAS